MKIFVSQVNKIVAGLALVMGISFSHTTLANNWIITSNNNCKAHNPNPQPNETATWSGECKDGYVHGYGILQWYQKGKKTVLILVSSNKAKRLEIIALTYPVKNKHEATILPNTPKSCKNT